MFATYPPTIVVSTWPGAFITEVVGTALLLVSVFATTDPRNDVPFHVIPLVVGFTVMSLGIAFGSNSAFALNPARDWGPRLYTSMAGWGSAPWTVSRAYFMLFTGGDGRRSGHERPRGHVACATQVPWDGAHAKATSASHWSFDGCAHLHMCYRP